MTYELEVEKMQPSRDFNQVDFNLAVVEDLKMLRDRQSFIKSWNFAISLCVSILALISIDCGAKELSRDAIDIVY